MKKTIIFILMVVALIPLVDSISSNKEKNESLALIDIDELLYDEKFIHETQEKLIEQYGNNYQEIIDRNKASVESAQKVELQFEKDTSGKIIYPEYFGGMYIDDKQELVIQVIKNKLPKASDEVAVYNNILTVDKDSKLEYVNYSKLELEQIYNIIVDYFLDSKNDTDNILAFYIDVPNNRIVVELENNSVKNIEVFKNTIINSDLLYFKKGEKLHSTSINAGQGIPTGCSVGYRVKKGNLSGFVTAAHCFPSGEGSASSYGMVKGWKLGPNVDAAFVQSTETFTNTLNWNTYPAQTLLVNDSMPYIIVGALVGKVGKTTHATTGQLASLNWSGKVSYKNIADVNVTDFIQANLNVQEGDSGGIVFQMGTNNKANVLGIVSAGNDAHNIMLASKLSNNKSALSVTRY